VGRENQLARMWALDGARHTSEIASWRFVSRGVMGVHGVMVMGVVGSGYVLSRLAPVSGVGPEELATPLKCQSWRSKKSDAAAESH